MIELVRDPSGEVQIYSVSDTTAGTKMTSVYTHYDNNSSHHPEDDPSHPTVAELKETIKSLKAQIEVSLVQLHVACIIQPFELRCLNCDIPSSNLQILNWL